MLRSIGLFGRDRPLARLYLLHRPPDELLRRRPGDQRLRRPRPRPPRPRRAGRLHVYFTGSAGNVTAGKYNDGSKPMRAVLADRVHAAMAAADARAATTSDRLDAIALDRPARITFAPARGSRPRPAQGDRRRPERRRSSTATASAMTCGWLIRVAAKRPILLGRLDLGRPSRPCTCRPRRSSSISSTPRRCRPADRWLATAAYGDDGPWYIPLERSYAEGGYEPSVSFVSRTSEPAYREAIRALLGPGRRRSSRRLAFPYDGAPLRRSAS